MGLPDATNIALHVLKETKEYVDSCGGGSQLIVLRKDGRFSNVGYTDLESGETMSVAFKEAARRLLVCSADLSYTEEKLREEFDAAYTLVVHARRELAAKKENQLTGILTSIADANFERWIIYS